MGDRTSRQRGSALVIVLLVLSVAGAYLALGGLSGIQEKLRRDQGTQAALAQAKQALVGFAATYPDNHANQTFGFLPCPDLNNDGFAENSCGGAAGVSVIGRLPWKTLGLPPLRDSAGECLWYAVSGRAKNNPQSTPLNWDTPGQFLLRDAAGNALAGASPHDRPLAVIFSPGSAIGAQTRTAAGNNECGGSNVIAAYLDGNDPIYSGAPPAPGVDSTLTLATTDSIRNGANNDQAQWLTADDIFQRVRMRSDFARDINALMDDIKNCLGNAPSLPGTSGSKGFDATYFYLTGKNNCTANITAAPQCAAFSDTNTSKRKLLDHWCDNLLYARPATPTTVNGQSCEAVLLFGGTRTGGQARSTPAQTGAAANYLEGANAATFPNGSGYSTPFPSGFDPKAPSGEVARCINRLPAGSISFARNLSSFTPAGTGVTVNATDRTVILAGGASTTGGCFWYPDPVLLAGRSLRAFYRYTFSFPDTRALTGSGTDRGNGFTFELVHADNPALSPTTPTPICGRARDMGALVLGTPAMGDALSRNSFIIETDVRQDPGIPGDLDPAGNHTAVMANGNLDHSPTNGNATTACNATVSGCLHTPGNKFEESPTPLVHNQRIEITTGCNSTCSACSPAGHGAPNNFARLRVWVDCTDCTDVTLDFPVVPSMQRCIALNPRINSASFGFTGGFRSGAASQGVTLQDFILFSQ